MCRVTPVEALQRWKLLSPDRWSDVEPDVRARLVDRSDPRVLPELCDLGVLEGGLSVALDLQPDELIGPLLARIGGPATRLKVEDVREGDGVLELAVSFAGREHLLEARRTFELVDALNGLLVDERGARAVAVLGEWNDMLQLWAIPKARLADLARHRWFAPENLDSLFAGPRDH